MNTELLKDLIKIREKHYPEGVTNDMEMYKIRDYHAIQMLIQAIYDNGVKKRILPEI